MSSETLQRVLNVASFLVNVATLVVAVLALLLR